MVHEPPSGDLKKVSEEVVEGNESRYMYRLVL